MKTLGDFRRATKDLPDDMVMIVAGEDSWDAEVDRGIMPSGGVATSSPQKPGDTPEHAFLYVEPRP